MGYLFEVKKKGRLKTWPCFQTALHLQAIERVRAGARTLHMDFRFHAGYGLLPTGVRVCSLSWLWLRLLPALKLTAGIKGSAADESCP
ncbi:hypothetical protein E4T99_02875 [Neisseria sp. WF04]|nr:hypothetical protein E4T99_02875 [Neisseria sp. WF04]